MGPTFWIELFVVFVLLFVGWFFLNYALREISNFKEMVATFMEAHHDIMLEDEKQCPNCLTFLPRGAKVCQFCSIDFNGGSQATKPTKKLISRKFLYSRVFREALSGIIFITGGTALVYFLPNILKAPFLRRSTLVGVSLIWLLIVLLIRKRLFKYIRSPGEDVAKLSNDSRPHILYLRSFQDDLLAIQFKRSLWGTHEEILASVLDDIGPTVCLPHPGARGQQPLGIVRVNVTEKDWQSTVMRFMSTAQLVILNVPRYTSEAIDWEIEAAIKSANPERLVFAFCAWHIRGKFVDTDYMRFREKMLRFLPYPLPEVDSSFESFLNPPLFLYFESDWTPRLISGHNHFFRPDSLWELDSTLFLRIALKPIFLQIGKKPMYWKYWGIKLALIILLIVVMFLFQFLFKLFHSELMLD